MKLIPRTLKWGGSALAISALFAALSAPVLAADPSEFSAAEKLVFADPHLSNLKGPIVLRYGFVKSGALEPGFTDEARIDIAFNGKACCTASGQFLTGERELKLPEIPEAQANPVILFFLERDIREMQRLTKGRANYYQKRIRMTMVDEAQVRPTKVSFQGREIPAQEVTLTPYVTDPIKSRYERFSQKRYTFVLAKDVPGGVYQIRTSMADPQVGNPAMIEEVMTFTGTEALTAAAKPATKTTTQ